MRISDWSSDVCSSDRGIELLPVLLQLRRRSAGLMSAGSIDGFEVPLYRALTEPILLGGAPRGIAILNGTLAAAMGLGLQQWIAGLLLWLAGHSLAVFAAKRDPDFASVLARPLPQKARKSRGEGKSVAVRVD